MGTSLAAWGLLQYTGWLPRPSGFPMTALFDNPAGFGVTLALIFPAGLYLLIALFWQILKSSRHLSQSKKHDRTPLTRRLYSPNFYLQAIVKLLICTALAAMLSAIILSGSRTAILSVIASSGIFLALQTGLLHRVKNHILHWKVRIPLVFIVLLLGCTAGLYQLKVNSANGRLFIWRVSATMVAGHPFFGCGHNCFQAKYMDYQARYFARHPNAPYSQLAGNDIHSFNKFILIAVEYGIIGLLFVLVFLFFLFRAILTSNNPFKYLCIAGLTGFLVAACFSYPLRYISVWLLVIFYGTVGVETKRFTFPNRLWFAACKVAVTGLAVACLLLTARQIRAQIQWNNIAHRALAENAKAILPEYAKLYSKLRQEPFFMYNYGSELAAAKRYKKSTAIFKECETRFTNYYMQLLLAKNYKKTGKLEEAEQLYIHAANMIPDRFWPLYQLDRLYKEQGKTKKAHTLAQQIVHKKVKIPSNTIASIKFRMKQFLDSLQVQSQ
jgi:tetratricopeptide (TPR) repeat protein